MPNILPVSDLRNYRTVLGKVSYGNPVYLTKNGRGAYAIVTMDDYENLERLKSIIELRSEIMKAVERDEKEGVLSEDEVKRRFGIK